MSSPTVVVHRDAPTLARAVAARLIVKLVDVQSSAGHAHIALTGGGMGTAVLAEVAASNARDAVDWDRLDVWWSDERFLPSGDPERNETGARSALLDQVVMDPNRVHPMPASDGPDGADVEAAAARYAEELAAAARPEDHGPVPSFDVLLLGVGGEGHVASLFPEAPALYDDRAVVAVHDCPKPPPTRISFTFPSLQAAKEIWLIAAGEEKAAAIRLALAGAGPTQLPAAGALGRNRTLWLLDQAAADGLPADRR